MAIKKYIAVGLRVICDSQSTIRRQGGHPARDPLPCCTPITNQESYMTPCRPKSTKIPPRTGGSSYFLVEKSPKSAFFDKNLLQGIIIIHFMRNRYRIKNIFTSGHFELYLFIVSGVIFAPSYPDES